MISEMGKSEKIPVVHEYSAHILEDMMRKLPPASQSHCIYRVPEQIRQVKIDAYTPVLVSIGPLHHTEKLNPMEHDKLKCLKSFLHDAKSNADIESFLRIVESREDEIRDCYAEAIVLPSDKLACLILVDSAFIIQIFRKIHFYRLTNDDQTLNPYKFQEVIRDMMLLENQLPFFILIDLYWTAFRPNETNQPCFTDLVCRVLDVKKATVQFDPDTGEATCCHLLDLLRSRYCPPAMEETDRDMDLQHLERFLGRRIRCPTATRLYESGIKFQGLDGDRCSWSNITFDKKRGILTIPKLEVLDRDEERLRNVIAFEQCHYLHHTNLTDFYFFLDCLINTPRDVELLVNAGIIQNWLGSDEEACNLFNSLRKYTDVTITAGSFHLAKISKNLSDYRNQRWNRYRAVLWHTYFRHPWAVMSFTYAVVLLVLTVVQVTTGILSV